MHGERKNIGIVPQPDLPADETRLHGKNLQHLTALEIRERPDQAGIFHQYFKFSIVRNPWDRMVATAAWRDKKWARGVELEKYEFEEAVRSVHARFLAAKKGVRCAAFRTMTGPRPSIFSMKRGGRWWIMWDGSKLSDGTGMPSAAA